MAEMRCGLERIERHHLPIAVQVRIDVKLPRLCGTIDRAVHQVDAFLWSSLICLVAGVLMMLPGRPKDAHLRPRDMYFLTTASWVVVCCFAALPMVIIQHISYTDSFFETMPIR